MQGRVKINNKLANKLGTKVNPDCDVVSVDEKVVLPENVQKIYIVLNKPRSCVTTLSDPLGRKTVIDLIDKLFGENLSGRPIGLSLRRLDDTYQ